MGIYSRLASSPRLSEVTAAKMDSSQNIQASANIRKKADGYDVECAYMPLFAVQLKYNFSLHSAIHI